MKYTSIYIRFHVTCLLKNRFYYVFVFLSYFYLAFYNGLLLRKEGSMLVYPHTDIYLEFIDQQFDVCSLMIIMVSMVLYENFFRIYENYFLIYIHKPAAFFHSMAGTVVILNVIPCLLGKALFMVYNYNQTGYWAFHWELTLIFVFEIVTMILFVIALYLFFRKIVLVAIAYVMGLFVSTCLNSIYFTIPLIMSAIDDGKFTPFTIDVWIGRVLLLALALGLYLLSVKMFLRRKD